MLGVNPGGELRWWVVELVKVKVQLLVLVVLAVVVEGGERGRNRTNHGPSSESAT